MPTGTEGPAFGLWVLSIAMAVLAGATSLWAEWMRRRGPRSEQAARSSERWTLLAYVLMTISILGFIARGLL